MTGQTITLFAFPSPPPHKPSFHSRNKTLTFSQFRFPSSEAIWGGGVGNWQWGSSHKNAFCFFTLSPTQHLKCPTCFLWTFTVWTQQKWPSQRTSLDPVGSYQLLKTLYKVWLFFQDLMNEGAIDGERMEKTDGPEIGVFIAPEVSTSYPHRKCLWTYR